MKSPRQTRRSLVAGLLLGAVLFAGCSDGSSAIEAVSPSAAASIIADEASEVILDIRTPEEFSEGIIEGATNIDFYDGSFAEMLDALDKDVHYVVYCRSGNRSGQSMSTFASLGFTNVTEISGGIADWSAQGLPVVLP